MIQLELFPRSPRWCVYTYGDPGKGYNFVGQIIGLEENCVWVRNIENGVGDPWDPVYVKECGNVFEVIDILYECGSKVWLTRECWADFVRGRFPNDFDREYGNYKSEKGKRIC